MCVWLCVYVCVVVCEIVSRSGEALRRWHQVNERMHLVHQQISPKGPGQDANRRKKRHEADEEEGEGEGGGGALGEKKSIDHHDIIF